MSEKIRTLEKDFDTTIGVFSFFRQMDFVSFSAFVLGAAYWVSGLFIKALVNDGREVSPTLKVVFLEHMWPNYLLLSFLLSYISITIIRNRLAEKLILSRHKPALKEYDWMVSNDPSSITSETRIKIDKCRKLISPLFFKGDIGFVIHIGLAAFFLLLILLKILWKVFF